MKCLSKHDIVLQGCCLNLAEDPEASARQNTAQYELRRVAGKP